MKYKVLLGLAMLCLLGVGASVVGWICEKDNDKPATRPPSERVVKLYKVQARLGNHNGITYPGRVRPVHHAELFFRVSGPVIERNLKYGQTVEEGDILMRVDPRDYQREVDRLTQELEMQKVQNNLAVIEYERNKKLLESDAVSKSVMDNATMKKNYSDAQVKMLEVSLKIAQDKLKDTVLYAPFHGTISELQIEQYEIAKANVPVVTLDDLREADIKISIPAGNLPDISIYDSKQFLGMTFDVTFPGRGERVLKAAINEFKPIAATGSETYEVTLRMKVPEDFLVLPGMSVEVHGLPYRTQAQQEQLIVPYSAVIQRDGKDVVWCYDPTKQALSLRNVSPQRVGESDFVPVDGDLKAGEYIVAAGGDWLNPQTVVQVMNPEVFHEAD